MIRLAGLIIIGFYLILSGCVSLKQPSPNIEYYTLEYDALQPDVGPDNVPVPAVIKLERFSISPIYNTDRIIYRDRDFKRTSYSYYKWRSNPADLVTYFLGRDLKDSGLFSAVISSGSAMAYTHVVEGSVNEFMEWDSDNDWEAVLSVSITLLVAREPDISKKVIFQKNFSARQVCEEKSPKAVVRAMSNAMARVSKEIGTSIHGALARK